jgi:two-component system, cell cycle sensor histidine kinase and response regulator CckA
VEALGIYGKRQDEISLVILDIVMPVMGGIECFRELININPHVRVVMAGGLISDEIGKQAHELGVRGLIRKPYERSKLLETVREVLDAD